MLSVMNTKHVITALTISTLSLLGARQALAQSDANAPGSPPPSAGVVDAPPDNFQATVDTPYAFRFHRLGLSAEAGELMNQQNFLGLEMSYWDAAPHPYDGYYNSGYIGHYHYRQDITTLDLAYRYYFPLNQFANGAAGSPVSLYVGASAGAGWVHDYLAGSGFTGAYPYINSSTAHFSAEGLAGVQFALAQRVSLRVGYRYEYISRTQEFFTKNNVDSGAIEAGLNVRF